jgi:hypothetical protein
LDQFIFQGDLDGSHEGLSEIAMNIAIIMLKRIVINAGSGVLLPIPPLKGSAHDHELTPELTLMISVQI